MKRAIVTWARRAGLLMLALNLLLSQSTLAQQSVSNNTNNSNSNSSTTTGKLDWSKLEEIFSSQTIRWYRPGVNDACTTGSAASSGPITKAVDYKNREVFNEEQIKIIEQFRPVYSAAAAKVGIPWEMLAVVHFRETRLAKTNPANGQGIYQDFARAGGSYPPGPVSDEEFQRQTDWAAKFLLEKAGSKGEALKKSEDDAVKYTFFAYNGLAGVYKKQALSLGFSQEQADNGEGSPYVMNKADEKRDPTTNPTGWGQIKSDGGSIQYPANQDHGAFVMYASLRGNATSCGNSADKGGLTKEQATKFVINYGANKDNFTANTLGKDLWEMCNGGGSNCVSFSYFFNKAFTNLPAGPGDGHGANIVKALAAKGAKTGTEPKVFSTFSWSGGEQGYGHTGIVLGIHGDEYIVGHASCGNQGIGPGDGHTFGKYGGSAIIMVGKKDNPKIWFDKIPTEFAYPDNVDTAKISKFIETGSA